MLALLIGMITVLTASGCGLQTDEANKALGVAMKHQEAAEQALARIKNFPAEWSAVFAGPRTAAQIAQIQQIVAAREADADTFDNELKAEEAALRPIVKLNVDDKVREFVSLKLAAVSSYRDYVSGDLVPLLKSYEGLVQQIAYSRPQAELNQAAAEILGMAAEAQGKLEEAMSAARQADDYFKDNKLGR